MTQRPHRRLGPICRRCWRPHLPSTWAAHERVLYWHGQTSVTGEAMRRAIQPGLPEALIAARAAGRIR